MSKQLFEGGSLRLALSLFVTLTMVLGMCPAVGLADEVEVEPGDDEVVVEVQGEGDWEDVESQSTDGGEDSEGLLPGMSLTADANGHVAKVGNQEYDDFNTAVAAWIGNGGTLTLLDDVTTDKTIYASHSSQNLTLDLNGFGIRHTGAVTNSNDENKGHVFRFEECLNLTFTLKDSNPNRAHYIELTDWRGTAVNNTGTESDANDGTGVVKINGGYITGGAREGDGGAINMGKGGTFIMEGGTILGNTATAKGGAVNYWGGTFTMKGGLIAYNSGGNFGGGVDFDAPGTVFSMSGGTISQNTARVGGGGVCVEQGTLDLTGNAVIKGNLISSDASGECNVYLPSNDKEKWITVASALGSSAQIGITMGTPGVFTNSNPTTYNDASKFTSDKTDYAVGKNANGQLFLGEAIASVEVTDITAPVATKALDTEAKTSTDKVTLGKVSWEPSTTSAAYATEYTATVIATAAEGYAFTNDATATVNGQTATATKNADGTLSISYTFPKTEKGASSVTKAPEAKSLTYTGSAQALVTAGTAEGGTMQYSLDGKTFSPDIPKATEVGEYTVWYKVVGDANHNDTEPQKVASTIAKKDEPAPAEVPPVSVTAHVQRKGTLAAVSGGAVAGTTGKSLRMESLKLTVDGASESGGIEYRGHVQRKGWETSWARDGAMAGTEGKSRRMEAVQIQLWGDMESKYDVYYRVHSQRYGWMAWAKNGEAAGTQGMSRRAEAIQVVLVAKDAPAPATDFQGATQAYAKAFAKK